MAAKEAAEPLEKKLNEFLDSDPSIRRDVIQMRALEAPIKLLRGEARWQVFLKMYAKEPSDRVISFMEELEEIPFEGVRVELEVNPNAML